MAIVCAAISAVHILVSGNAPHSRVAFANVGASLLQYFVLHDETEPTPVGIKAAVYLNCSLAAYAFSGAPFGLPMWVHCTALWISLHVQLTETSKSERFSSYAVSVVHAFVMSLFCLYHADYAFTDADPFDSSTTEAQNVYWANHVFASYLIHDIVYVIFDPSEAKSILMHHFGFLSVSIMNGTLRMFPSAFIWLIAGEVSTVALSLSKIDNPSRRQFWKLLFVPFFFLFRIVLYLFGMIALFKASYAYADNAPSFLAWVSLLLTGLGYVLNVYWFFLILKMAKSEGAKVLEVLGWSLLNQGLVKYTNGKVCAARGPQYGTYTDTSTSPKSDPQSVSTMSNEYEDDDSLEKPTTLAPAVMLINVHPLTFIHSILVGGELELGESYVRRVWSEDAPGTSLYDVLEGLAEMNALSEKLDFLKYGSWTWWDRFFKFSERFGALDKKQSADSIAAHYDDGNKLFRKFLGEDMVYTSGAFWQYNQDMAASLGNGLEYLREMPGVGQTRDSRVQKKEHIINLSLEQAQKLKVERLLDLAGSDAKRLMDIGSGWGYLVHAAKERGFEYAVGLCNCKSMNELATEKYGNNYSMLDYRDVPPTHDFDVVTSVEMIEAVPAKHYPDFVKCCDNALKPGGRVVMQVIHAFAFNNSVARSRDPTALGTFVTTHIFPGQQLPNLDFLHEAFLKSGKFKRVYSETTGHDYAKTLRQWRLRLDGPSEDGFVIPDHIQRKYRFVIFKNLFTFLAFEFNLFFILGTTLHGVKQDLMPSFCMYLGLCLKKKRSKILNFEERIFVFFFLCRLHITLYHIHIEEPNINKFFCINKFF